MKLLTVGLLLFSSLCFAKPNVYIDFDENGHSYLTNGTTKVPAHMWGIYPNAESIFKTKEGLEYYQEYLHQEKMAGCAFLTIPVITAGVGILLNNVGISNPTPWIVGDIVLGYLVLGGATGHHKHKAMMNFIKAINAENGVYSSGAQSSEETGEKKLSLAFSKDPVSHSDIYGLALQF